MACDMCGAKGVSLEDLREGYKTDDIKQICSKCNSVVTDHLWKLRSVTDGMLKTTIKRFMTNTMKEI